MINMSVYLHRHWPNRLPLEEAIKLPTHRLLAYYRKHYGKRSAFKNGYPDTLKHANDDEYNSEFGTSAHQQFKGYFDALKAELDKRENIN